MGNLRAALFLLAGLVCSGCFTTTVGFADPAARSRVDFGQARAVNVCVYLDDGISEGDARELLSSWDSEAPLYGLYINPVLFQPHPRSGFSHGEILDDVAAIPLQSKCDRVLYFANRNAWDYLYANFPNPVMWPLPEVLGEVDDSTMTHGFVVAKADSLNGLLFSPYRVTRHELYHLLGGCPHALSLDRCYDRIALLKGAPVQNFFPSESADGRVFTRRQEVNRELASLPPKPEGRVASATRVAP